MYLCRKRMQHEYKYIKSVKTLICTKNDIYLHLFMYLHSIIMLNDMYLHLFMYLCKRRMEYSNGCFTRFSHDSLEQNIDLTLQVVLPSYDSLICQVILDFKLFTNLFSKVKLKTIYITCITQKKISTNISAHFSTHSVQRSVQSPYLNFFTFSIFKATKSTYFHSKYLKTSNNIK